MCDLEENMEHVFSCNSATVKKTHHEALKLIKWLLSKNNQDLAQWWCTMINSCWGALGALPIEEFLPAEQKEVLVMRAYQDMSFKDIAEQTEVSINTALGRMRYALKRYCIAIQSA